MIKPMKRKSFYSYFLRKSPIQKQIIFHYDKQSGGERVSGLVIRRYRPNEEIPKIFFEQLLKFQPDMAQKFVDPSVDTSGKEAWLGFIDDRLAALQWTSSGKFRQNYYVPLAKNDTVLKAGFVPEEYRGRGIFTAILEHVVVTLSKEQDGEIYTDCVAGNESSIRGIVKAGFSCIGEVWRFSLGKYMYILRNTYNSQN